MAILLCCYLTKLLVYQVIAELLDDILAKSIIF